MTKRKTAARAFFSFMLPTLFAACVLSGFSGCKLDADELVLSVKELPDNMNPILRQNASARMLNDLLYQGLTGQSGRKPDDIQLELADNIIQDDEDKSKYRIELRRDVVWHDGRPFSVSDVLYTWSAIREEHNQSPFRGQLLDIVDRFTAIDDYTLLIDFRYPVAPDDARWLLSFRVIPSRFNDKPMPADLSSGSVGRQFAANPIGTGPCRFVERKSNSLILEAAREYMSIREVRFQIQRDPEVGAVNLTKGRTDMIFDVDPELFDHLDTRAFPYAEYKPKAFYALALNTMSGPLDDPFLREAVALAIDREAIYMEIFNEIEPQYLMRKPYPYNDHRRYRRLDDIQVYNREKAVEMVSHSRYDGGELTLIYPRMMGSIGKKSAQLAASMLGNVGINVDVKETGNNFYTNLQRGKYDIALTYESDFGRKYNHFDLYYSGSPRNVTRIADADLDRLLIEWDNSIVMNDKYPLARRINEMLDDLNPYAYLFAPPMRLYHSPNLQGVVVTDGDVLLKTLSEWSKM